MTVSEQIIQWCILILGASAIYLVSRKERECKLHGFAIGLCSQPFWLYETFAQRQWGMFALSVWYTMVWINGIRNHIKQKEN
jgi:hypothetical protein